MVGIHQIERVQCKFLTDLHSARPVCGESLPWKLSGITSAAVASKRSPSKIALKRPNSSALHKESFWSLRPLKTATKRGSAQKGAASFLGSSLAVDPGVRMNVSGLFCRDWEFHIIAPWAGCACDLGDKFSNYMSVSWVVLRPCRINEVLLLYVCHVLHSFKLLEQKSPQQGLNLTTS
ncbi:hypothetical protein N24_0936 [Corynebacterium suranareeae]|uniref:Uncharacterized protein n=1 Tax=Corynebacterium suranareeae TaxID=2506452 RepID=A0A169RSE8_9CORY|nr:hypothetical protein N24_0936 [Corynebacterium suranareeae]